MTLNLLRFSPTLQTTPYFNASYLRAVYGEYENIHGIFEGDNIQQIVRILETPFGGLCQSSHIWQWPSLALQPKSFAEELLAMYYSYNLIAGYNRLLSSIAGIQSYPKIQISQDLRKWHLIIDVSKWICRSHSLKSSLHSFKRSGGAIRHAQPSDASTIANIYTELAESKSFSREYYSGTSLFYALIMDPNFLSYVALDSDDTIQGFAIFSQHRTHLDYSLAASTHKLNGSSAALIHALICDMQNNGDERCIFLGGGIAENDGLDKFKANFSDEALYLYHLKVKADPLRYSEYLEKASFINNMPRQFPVIADNLAYI